MIDLSKTPYKKLPWDFGDRSKYDYGNPPQYSSPYPPGDELDTIAEWEKMAEMQDDLIITY